VSSIGRDNRIFTTFRADTQKHKPKVKYRTVGYHNVGLEEDKHITPSSDERKAFARLAQDW
jgi:hypothetical protein